MRLFEIGQEFEALYSVLEDVETDENGVIIDNSETIKELYEALKIDLNEKLDNSALVCKELKGGADLLKAEAKRLTEKARVLENREKRLRELMKNAILESGETKVKSKFNFNVSTREVYNYDDVNLFGLDRDFIKIKEEIDKTKLKQFIKAGGEVEGVRISEDTSLTVR